jgi:polyisoprenoid-binding protein YceI
MSVAVETGSKMTAWNLDAVHSTAQFKVKHMMISNVSGEFTVMSGTLAFNGGDITKSTIDASIDSSSINTKDPQRDDHLKSADFLDVEKYPVMRFTSSNITNGSNGVVAMSGRLSIRGVSRGVDFEVEGPKGPILDPYGNMRMGFWAVTRISRKDFGLKWNAALETGGVVVGDEVTITLDLEFVKAPRTLETVGVPD